MWIPRMLAPLVIVGATLAASSAQAAMLTQVHGDVQVDRGYGFQAVTGAMALASGDRLHVGLGGTAQLLYPDGCVFPPAAGTALTVAEQSPCAIRARYQKPSYAGVGDQFTHTIGAPKKPASVQRYAPARSMTSAIARAKAKPLPSNLFNEAHLVRTSPPLAPPQIHAGIQPAGQGQMPSPPGQAQFPPFPPGQAQCVDLNGDGKLDPQHECPSPEAGLPQTPSGQAVPQGVAQLPPPPPVAPAPNPLLGGLGAGGAGGLSTGVMIAGGAAAIGGVAVIASAAGKQQSKKPASP